MNATLQPQIDDTPRGALVCVALKRDIQSGLCSDPEIPSEGGPDRSTVMSDATVILAAIEKGEPKAADRLLTLVYDDLRRLAAFKMAQEAGHGI
jgi:hypothetical protein